MSGYEIVSRIHKLEEHLATLGFSLSPPEGTGAREALASIKPNGRDGLPVYSRDASIFTGSIEGIECWVAGAMWSREYDKMLGLSNTEKRQRKEQDIRNKQLAIILGE